jgi:hypothetical protein
MAEYRQRRILVITVAIPDQVQSDTVAVLVDFPHQL